MDIERIPDLRERMLAAVLAEGHRLDMKRFGDGDTITDRHPCGTTCCLAGWAINCHPQGASLLKLAVKSFEEPSPYVSAAEPRPAKGAAR